MTNDSESDYLVTLVHGTFAFRAPWVRDHGSALRAHLRENLPGTVKFRGCVWSGRNKNKERQRAATRLATKIERQARAFPNSQQIIIGHSHGGNVAVHGVARSGCHASVAAVVGMNTPWICATRRNTLQLVTLFTIVGFVAFQLYLFGVGTTTFASSSLLVQSLVGLGIAGILISGIFLGAWLGPKIGGWLKHKREALIELLQPPALDDVSVLCIWGGDDEVRNVFTVLEAIENIPFLLLHWISVLAMAVLIFVGHKIDRLPQSVQFVLEPMPDKFSTWLQENFVIFASSLIYLALTMLGLLALIFVINIVLRSLPVGVAVVRFYHSAFIHLSFTLVPVTAKRTDFREIQTPSFFSHSSVYEDETALQEIVSWVKATIHDSERQDGTPDQTA